MSSYIQPETVDELCARLKIPKKDIVTRTALSNWEQAVRHHEMMGRRMFRIWNHERGKWWLRSRFGYTSHVDEAGQFTYHEALELVRDANIKLEEDGKLQESIVPVPM